MAEALLRGFRNSSQAMLAKSNKDVGMDHSLKCINTLTPFINTHTQRESFIVMMRFLLPMSFAEVVRVKKNAIIGIEVTRRDFMNYSTNGWYLC